MKPVRAARPVRRGGPLSRTAQPALSRRVAARPDFGGRVAPARTPPRRKPFIILTGLSGAGKTHAIRALEDLDYFSIDNLPTQMLPMMAELATREGTGIQKVAIVVDVREGGFLKEFPEVFRRLKLLTDIEPKLIFLEADQPALVRRFSETRRPHPLAKDRSVTEGIREERAKLNAIRRMADLIIDTSNLTVHELRDVFMRLSHGKRQRNDMIVNLVSFGYKHGVPADADLVFDVRCLPNPHFVDRLRRLTGRVRAVIQYMKRHPETKDFLDRLSTFLRFAVPQYVREGKTYLTVAVGCTGGQHRSVWMAEALKKTLGSVKHVRLRVKHRDS